MNQLKRMLWLLVFVVLAISTAFPQAGFINVTSTKLTNLSGVTVTNATICGQLEAAGVGYSVKVSGGGQTTQAPVCATVTNGAFSLMLPDTALTNPANACVDITVTDNTNGNTLLGNGYDCVQPTSAAGSPWCSTSSGTTTCNFDLFSPYYPGLPTAAPSAVTNPTVFPATSSVAGSVLLAAGQTSNVLSKVATTGQYADILGAPAPGTVAPATSTTSGSVLLATGQTSNLLSKVATTGAYTDLSGTPTAILPATSSLAGTLLLATGQTSNLLSKVATTGLYTDLTNLPTLGLAAQHGISTTINGVTCSLDGSCSIAVPLPLTLQTNGTTNPDQALLNLVAGSGMTITSSANGTVLISYATPSALPTPPSTAYIYSNLQNEPTTCPSYISASSQGSASNCWTADSIDATGAAGAGIATPTLLNFSVTSPSLSSGGSMQSSVSNAPPQVVSATGTSGATSVVVASITNIVIGSTVTGTGIGSGAAVANTWNKASTTIPLTVANSATVSGNITFATTFVSNSLFYRHLLSASAPTTPAAVTTGTLTINPGTITANDTSITFTGMTATDTTYPVTAIQVYVDGAGTPAFTNGTGSGPYSPATTTIALTPGLHTYAAKAFDSNGTSSTTATGTVTVGGANVVTITHLLEDMYFYTASSNTPQAYEFDPDIFNNGWQYLGSMQCRIAGTSPTQWYFWNSALPGWALQSGFTYACPTPSANTWHHYQLYVTYDTTNHVYFYQTFVLDGTTIYQNINLQFGASGGHSTIPLINLQHQIDNTSSTPRTGPGNTVYYDNYTLTAW